MSSTRPTAGIGRAIALSPCLLLLAAALLSNEIAYLIVPVAFLLLLHRPGRRPEHRRQLALAVGGPLLCVVGTLMLRVAVGQGLGGYPSEAGGRGRLSGGWGGGFSGCGLPGG